MPILKASEPLQARPVIILIHGEPGVGKTSLFNTSRKPLLINFDRGHDRAIMRKDTLIMTKWEDVQAEEKAGTFKDYSTLGIDTAKAALDDFLFNYVCRMDMKNAKNKLAAYGAIGDEFKLFIAARRLEDSDIIIIAHSKDEKGTGDISRKVPDVTGGSYQLLLRIADQVGYMSRRNGQRMIEWEPSEEHIGKNVARLQTTIIPDAKDPALKEFMAGIVDQVRQSIVAVSEEQAAAIETSQAYTDTIAGITSPDELTRILAEISALPKVQNAPLKIKINDRMKALKWTYDAKEKKFVDPNAKAPADKPAAPAAETKTAESIVPNDSTVPNDSQVPNDDDNHQPSEEDIAANAGQLQF